MAFEYPKRLGVITESYAEQINRDEALAAPKPVYVAQWVRIGSETYWGYPLVLNNRIVGVDFVQGEVVEHVAQPFPTSAEPAYQRLWTKAVGTPGYVKAEWQAFGKMIGVTQ